MAWNHRSCCYLVTPFMVFINLDTRNTHRIPSKKLPQTPSLPANLNPLAYGGHSVGQGPPRIHHTPQLSGHSIMPTPGYPSYHHDVFTTAPTPDPLQLVLKQLQKLDTRMSTIDAHISTIESSNKSILKAQEEISGRMQKNEETTQQVQTALTSLTKKPTKSGKSKNISNQHPKLKGVIHPMFFDLCGVNRSVGSSERIEVLASYAPHPGGEPFVMDGEKPIWRPAWGEKIDQGVNAKLISKVINRVWDAETVNEHSIMQAWITYLILQALRAPSATQIMTEKDPAKHEKYENKQKVNRQHARRAIVAGNCRSATAAFEAHYGVEGAAALINTNFMSDSLSYRSREVRGLKWCLLNFIAFLHILNALQKQGNHSVNSAAKSPPSKPYKPMCNPIWLQAHPSADVVEGMPWLQGFYEKAKDGNLTTEDCNYLAELAAHLAKASESVCIPVDVTVLDTATCTA
ncbi:hypothetical protein V8E55_002334 [Tylopilus felleus]